MHTSNSAEQPRQEILYVESLSPQYTPEIAFQSYEMLDGDKAHRQLQKKQFLSGEQRNPSFDYPLIDEPVLLHKISVLDGKLREARVISDPVARDATMDTISYRMAEMYWLLEASRLHRLGESSDSEEFQKSIGRYQEANEELYGRLDETLTRRVYNEIWQQIDAKDLGERGRQLRSELLEGTSIQVADEAVEIPSLPRFDDGERLPKINGEILAPLREFVLKEFADFKQLVQAYYESVCLARDESDSKYGEFTVHDMQEIFTAVHELRDPDNKSGISIRVNPNATQLSWDTPTMSVVVGGKRRSIDSPNEMLAKVVHEYGVHGVRAVNGRQTELPIFGAGLYTDTSEGEQSDYLTFEEGFATLCEAAILEEEVGWEPTYISRYLVAVSSYDGLDFRQSFEQNWRVRVLMLAKSGEEISDELIKKEKNSAYLSVTRIRRGSLTDRQGVVMPTFNKDLAYLKGKVIALDYLSTVGDDQDKLRRLFIGKFDPTNTIQNNLADKYGNILSSATI